MIKAVIFDMDGLLIDSEPLWRKAEIEIFKDVGIYLTEDDCRETMGYRLNEVVDLWHSRHPWKSPDKITIENKIIDRVSELIMQEGKILTGVKETINTCQNAGLKTAIASSSPMKLINSVVKLLNMNNHFHTLHSAEFEEYGKPHPGIFISAAKMLDVSPDECLVLEDSFHGMIAGLAAKMKVVVVPEPEGFDNLKFKAATEVLNSLDALELKKYL